VASLSVTARAARVDARRTRRESRSLKLRVRGNLNRAHERLGQAKREASKARARRGEPLPSPWSELRWTRTYESLDRTLVPLG
jgi:hypothetical protein